MDTIELTIIEYRTGKEHKFYYNLVNKGMGSSCLCYSAIDSEQRQYLIKEFKATDKFVEQKSIQLRNAITVIKNAYIARCGNYQLDDALIGYANVNGKKQYYQVFRFVSGREIECFNSTPNKVENALSLFLDLLKSLRIFHEDIGMLHFDIKPSNIYTYFDNPGSFQNAQLLDFDSAKTIDEFISDLSGRNPNKKFIYSSSFPWYSTEDFQKFTSNDPRNLRYSYNPLKYCLSLDLTASARVFSYMLCGNDANESGKLPPSQEELTRYLEQLPQEGIRFALERFFAKAFADELKDRYLNVSDMIDDIEAIQDCFNETSQTIIGYNARAINKNETLKSIYHVDSFFEVGNKIDTRILTDIKCDRLNDPFTLDKGNGSALEQLFSKTTENIWLTGEAGGGKSTALHYFFWSFCQKHFSDTIVVYKKLSECEKFGEDYSTIGLDKIVDTSKIIDLRSPVVILLDGYDEIERRRSLESSEKQKIFDSAFAQAIETANSNFRFIIASRFLPEVVRESELFISVTNQSLRDENIYEYLQIDNDGADRIKENKSLLELLRNPFCLTLFSNLREENANIAYEITTEAELIEKYLWSTYKSKARDMQNKKSFDRFIVEIARITLNNVCVDENIYENIYEKPIIHYFNNYIDLKLSDQNNYEIFFGHELIREYFIACGMKNKFLEIQLGKINPDAISFLDNHYSYETLLLFAQMTLCSKIEAWNQKNKLKLEYLCENFRALIPIDLSNFSSVKKEPSEEENWFDILIDEEVNADKMRQGMIYCFEKNMLNMVAFASDGDLSSGFDFGKITAVGRNAFRDCDYLKKIKLPNTFTAIQEGAFSWCEALEEVFLPDSIKYIEESVFTESGIREINLSKSLNTIPTSTFWGCNNLSNITIPEGVVKIEGFAFADCKNLKEITLPSSLKFIGPLAFHGAGLKKLLIPKNVNQIMPDAFAYCPIERIDVDPYNKKYSCFSNCLIETKKQTLILGCKNSKIISSEKVKYIGAHAFNGCHIERITIPCGVVAIYNCAFEGCVELKEIILPQTLEKIYFDAFFGCSHLERIHIPEALSSIATGAFKGCSGLLEITVDEKNRQYQSVNNCLIEISTKALMFGGYKDVSIPSDDSVTAIAESAFQQCRELKTILIPQNILSIGMSAFYDCLELQSIELQCKLKELEDFMFWGCENLSEINLPSTLKRIGNSAFHKCKSLRKLSLPQGLETIEDAAFHTCSNLRFLNIPEGVTSIGADLFQYCNNLEALTIPITVKSIGDSIFFDCFKLQGIFYEGTMNDWENIQKIPPEGEEWSIGNNCKWTGMNYKFPITIQCQDGKIEY